MSKLDVNKKISDLMLDTKKLEQCYLGARLKFSKKKHRYLIRLKKGLKKKKIKRFEK